MLYDVFPRCSCIFMFFCDLFLGLSLFQGSSPVMFCFSCLRFVIYGNVGLRFGGGGIC